MSGTELVHLSINTSMPASHRVLLTAINLIGVCFAALYSVVGGSALAAVVLVAAVAQSICALAILTIQATITTPP